MANPAQPLPWNYTLACRSLTECSEEERRYRALAAIARGRGDGDLAVRYERLAVVARGYAS